MTQTGKVQLCVELTWRVKKFTKTLRKFASCPNFEEEELFQEIRQKSFSPKQMPWEPSKIKDFNEVLERNEYH